MYNKGNFRRVAGEFEEKRKRAEDAADRRRREVESAIPELRQLHQSLSESGMEIFSAAISGGNADEALARIRQKNDALRKRKKELLTNAGYPANYTDPQYECAMCHDSGYSGGLMCSCMKEALVVADIESSGLGVHLRSQSFDNFSLKYYSGGALDAASTNLKLLREFAGSFTGKNDPSWLLIGATGLGKTHLSSAVAMHVIRRGFDVVYVTAGALFSVFEKQRFGEGSVGDGNDERFFEAELLIIDDLGTEVSNQFTVSCLYNVINSRLTSGLSTIINTNLTGDELRSRYADRITSRLFGEFRPLIFTGKDIRAQKLRG